uniref:Uncharacterized protein n=1 Tax=Arundo donax TaxID=35708 RepID=A0A0A9CAA6_ARUDO
MVPHRQSHVLLVSWRQIGQKLSSTHYQFSAINKRLIIRIDFVHEKE